MGLQIFKSSPGLFFKKESLVKEARAAWGDDFVSIGIQLDGTAVFSFVETAIITQADIDALVSAHNPALPSDSELDNAAMIEIVAELEAIWQDSDFQNNIRHRTREDIETWLVGMGLSPLEAKLHAATLAICRDLMLVLRYIDPKTEW
jgi:hypothetical protein